MNPNARIKSILKASFLDPSVTGLRSFYLSELDLPEEIEFELPTNLRLGHLTERVVGALIKSSTNYEVLYENVQLVEDKITIGEIDFIIENRKTKQVLHLELAYKFYLFDPTISSDPINNWMGPNRNDSLIKKIEKVKSKQFPLLYHKAAKSIFPNIKLDEVAQALCLLVSLFVPFEYKDNFLPIYKKAIKGYYLNVKTFNDFDHSEKYYYLPTKNEWGIDPSENKIWIDFEDAKKIIDASIDEKKAPLCWQKHNETYSTFFIVWW